ncbi:MgtC/SapB family protein [Rubripirellula lacrimiformis]|nr:MgtC/SapB family protein [Rubripirellula lacrimiformis]
MNYAEIFTPTAAAMLLGGVIGIERQISGHFAGLRTHMLVSLGAALFILSCRESTTGAEFDLTRVVQGIAAGVGFIGGGAILKTGQEHKVHGLTSASSVWLSAAIGTTCGLAQYPLAVTSAVMGLFILTGLRPVEGLFAKPKKKTPKSPHGGTPKSSSRDDQSFTDD